MDKERRDKMRSKKTGNIIFLALMLLIAITVLNTVSTKKETPKVERVINSWIKKTSL